jgi:hypothetical protein
MEIERKGTEETPDYGGIILNALMSPARLNELPPPEPLIKHFLNRDTIAAIYGRYGTYKTFLALSMACCVASGLPWFGHAVHAGPVLYVLAEGVAGMARRQGAWLLSEGMTVGKIDGIRWYPSAVNLLEAGWAQGLATAAATLGAVLVVIDTLNRSMPGADENGSGDMGKLVAAADRVRRDTGATVLFVHHPPRGGTNLRGSTALEGAVDTALFTQMMANKIVRLSSGADGVTGKQKDMESFEDIYFELEKCHGSAVPRLATAPEAGGSSVEDIKHRQELLVQTCIDNGPTSASQLIIVSTSSTPTTNRDLAELVKAGRLRNIGTVKRRLFEAVPEPAPVQGTLDQE